MPRARSFKRCALLAAALACAIGMARAAPESVTLVVSEESPAYMEVVGQIRTELSGDPARARVTLVRADAYDGSAARGADDLVVALGVRAAQKAAVPGRGAVLNVLIPRSAFERIAREAGRAVGGRYSALYLDQPPARQINLARVALPAPESIGVIVSEDSQDQLRPLQAAARQGQMRLVAERVGPEQDLLGALQNVLKASDVLLAVPDVQVYNSGTLQNILLTSYRYQRPVIGFSPAYVRAGALLAVYSTPAQIGLHAGETVRAYLSARELPAPQYPKYFSVGVNARLARSLNLALEDEVVLEVKLRRAEGG